MFYINAFFQLVIAFYFLAFPKFSCSPFPSSYPPLPLFRFLFIPYFTLHHLLPFLPSSFSFSLYSVLPSSLPSSIPSSLPSSIPSCLPSSQVVSPASCYSSPSTRTLAFHLEVAAPLNSPSPPRPFINLPAIQSPMFNNRVQKSLCANV